MYAELCTTPYMVGCQGLNAVAVFYQMHTCCLSALQLESVGTRGATRRALAARWNMPAELALDVAGLALYDVIIMAGMPCECRAVGTGSRHICPHPEFAGEHMAA